jgi:hypothetical protein
VFEHFLSVADEMFGIDDRKKFDTVFAAQVRQRLLALDLGKLAEISSPPGKVEGVINETVLIARSEVCLELREVGPCFMDDYYFPVDDRLTGNVERAGNNRKPLRPVQAIAGKNAALPLVQVDLDPVAVELDFMKPLIPFGTLARKVASWGLMNPGISAETDAAIRRRIGLAITS